MLQYFRLKWFVYTVMVWFIPTYMLRTLRIVIEVFFRSIFCSLSRFQCISHVAKFPVCWSVIPHYFYFTFALTVSFMWDTFLRTFVQLNFFVKIDIFFFVYQGALCLKNFKSIVSWSFLSFKNVFTCFTPTASCLTTLLHGNISNNCFRVL